MNTIMFLYSSLLILTPLTEDLNRLLHPRRRWRGKKGEERGRGRSMYLEFWIGSANDSEEL
jgi:hypothetical protein